LNIPNHVSFYYLINVIIYKHSLFLLFSVNGNRHIFPQKTHVAGKIEIDTVILLKLWIYEKQHITMMTTLIL